MHSLESFTSVEPVPIVYCRASKVWAAGAQRYLTWRQTSYEDLFGWLKTYPLPRYAQAWDRRIVRRGGLTFMRFRERIRQIALEATSYLEGVIVVNDFRTLRKVASRLKNFIVLPVDDDDWFSTDIGNVLRYLDVPPGIDVVAWPDLVWLCDFGSNGELIEKFSVQASKEVPQMVGSNCYAITREAFFRWNEQKLLDVLNHHWKVIGHVEPRRLEVISDSLNLEIKHIGSTTVLLQEASKVSWWNTNEYNLPSWSKDSCEKIRELHRELLADMGGIFDRQTIIQETKQPEGDA